MFTNAIGEWGQYETWELREIVTNLENDLSTARMALENRLQGKRKNYSREERKSQIRKLLGDGRIRTTAQIASALGISPSQNLRNILCELFTDHSIGGYAEGAVAHHYVYYWFDQRTLPLPFQESAYAPPCQGVVDGGFLSSERVAR